MNVQTLNNELIDNTDNIIKVLTKLGHEHIQARGKFLGMLNDSGQMFAVYVSGNQVYLKDLDNNDDAPAVYSIYDVFASDTSASIANIPTNDPELIKELKDYINKVSTPDFSNAKAFKTANGNINIVIGAHSISAAQLERLIVANKNLDPNGIYRIFAFDSSRVGYYVNDDLSTFT